MAIINSQLEPALWPDTAMLEPSHLKPSSALTPAIKHSQYSSCTNYPRNSIKDKYVYINTILSSRNV